MRLRSVVTGVAVCCCLVGCGVGGELTGRSTSASVSQNAAVEPGVPGTTFSPSDVRVYAQVPQKSGFAPPSSSIWQLPTGTPIRVICIRESPEPSQKWPHDHEEWVWVHFQGRTANEGGFIRLAEVYVDTGRDPSTNAQLTIEDAVPDCAN